MFPVYFFAFKMVKFLKVREQVSAAAQVGASSVSVSAAREKGLDDVDDDDRLMAAAFGRRRSLFFAFQRALCWLSCISQIGIPVDVVWCFR